VSPDSPAPAPERVAELERLRTGAAVVSRPGHGFVEVVGPDAVTFLQALVSADVAALADGQGTKSLLLAPQGKLEVAFRALRVGDALWLDCDPGQGSHLAALLGRYRIRVKAEVHDRSDDWAMLSVVGPGTDAVAAALTDGRGPMPRPRARHDHAPWGLCRVVRTSWSGTPGVDVIGPRAEVASVAEELAAAGWSGVAPETLEAFRIAAGIAVQPDDLDDQTIPQEAHLEADSVSFTKGCFLGQELVCRIDSRGHVNRFLRRLVDVEGPWPAPGTPVRVGDKVVGHVTSVAPVSLPVGALGYVRREVDVGATVELVGEAGVATARVERLDPPVHSDR
jgi:folate-binding protein YgfZ